jgi:hypothetical protein
MKRDIDMTETDEALIQSKSYGTVFWCVTFFVASFGSPLLARYLGLGTTATMACIALSMLLLIPLIRSTERAAKANNASASGALRRYNKRMLVFTASYVGTLFAANIVHQKFAPTGPALWALALLPSLPVLYFLWTWARFINEETDEFLKINSMKMTMVATGFLLGVATIWGFFESFDLVPHVQAYMALPVWAIGLFLNNIIDWVRR